MARECVKNKDIDTARIYIDRIEKNWEGKNKKIAMIIAHDQLEDIEISIAVLKANLESEEYNDFIVETYRMSTKIENFKDMELPTINNIF